MLHAYFLFAGNQGPDVSSEPTVVNSTSFPLFFRYHLVILHRGLPGGCLGVDWGEPLGTPSQPPRKPQPTPFKYKTDKLMAFDREQ